MAGTPPLIYSKIQASNSLHNTDVNEIERKSFSTPGGGLTLGKGMISAAMLYYTHSAIYIYIHFKTTEDAVMQYLSIASVQFSPFSCEDYRYGTLQCIILKAR